CRRSRTYRSTQCRSLAQLRRDRTAHRSPWDEWLLRLPAVVNDVHNARMSELGSVTEGIPHDVAAAFAGDPGVVAIWLEGSWALGTADAWSDTDIHVAVDDVAFDHLASQARIREVLEGVAEIRGMNRLAFGPDMVLYFATLAGPNR